MRKKALSRDELAERIAQIYLKRWNGERLTKPEERTVAYTERGTAPKCHHADR